MPRGRSRIGASGVVGVCALAALFATVSCLGCARAAEQKAESAPARKTGVTERVSLAWDDIPPSHADAERRPAAPLLLTANDGAALDLSSVEAHGVVVGPLAFTELHLTFKNPAPRVVEGTFGFTLPPSGAISRFAMRVGDRLMEGEVVERRSARQVYERFLHRNVDPALLEHQAGNAFSARVFPIAAHEEKLIVVSYSEELGAADAPYHIPLRGLPQLEALTIVVHHFETGDGTTSGTDRHRIYRVDKKGFVPDRDFVIPQHRSPTPAGEIPESAVMVQAGRFAVARVSPRIEAAPELPKRLAILIDTSASRALSLSRDVEVVQRVLEALRSAGARDLGIVVHAFDQEVEEIYRGPAADFRNSAVKRVLARGAFGATDFGAALRAVAGGNVKDRILLVTDGVLTAGPGSAELAPLLAQLAAAGVERVDALVTGGIRDEGLLARLTSGGRRRGVIVDAATGPARIARKLSVSVTRPLNVEVPGARFYFPRTFAGLVPGDSALVYAELRQSDALKIRVDGRELAATAFAAPVPLVQRAVARAEIDDVWQQVESGAFKGEELERARARVVQLSTEHRVVSPLTSFLVLETEGDYQRFRLDRRALKDILTVGPDGLAVLQRGDDWWRKMASRKLELVKSGSEPQSPPGDVAQAGKPPSPSFANDRDRDGILDFADRCPDAGVTGSANAIDNDGCPVRATVLVESSNVRILAPVDFYPGTARLFVDALPILDEVAELMRQDRELRIVVRGHTDSQGDPAKNLRLSEDRARAVRDYLISRGIPARRLAATGCGSNEPVSDDTPEGRARNRRVEFRIVQGSFTDSLCGPAVPPTPRGQRLPPPIPRPGAPRVVFQPPRASPVYHLPRPRVAPHQGPFAEVMAHLAAGRSGDALAQARRMQQKAPGDVLALFALGSSHEALGQGRHAARAYGSIIDLYSGHAPYRRFAGSLLDRLAVGGDAASAPRARELAIDTYRRAFAERPDHPSSHRLYAFALVRAGRHEEAFRILDKALDSEFAAHVRSVRPVFESDLALVARAWMAAEPGKAKKIAAELEALGIEPKDRRSLHVAATWETDASDVDLYLDPGHALKPGTDLERLFPGIVVADVEAGFGPDLFEIDGPASGRTVRLGVYQASAGPMGYAFGKVELIRHDGSGRLDFDERPFVLMVQHGYAELGSVKF